jgi:hypothetical protein
MRALSGEDIVLAWEHGHRQHPVDRALTLLALAAPGETRRSLAALSMGRRDALLLALREATFGGLLSGLVTCGMCGTLLDLQLPAAELRGLAETPGAEAEVVLGELRLRVRAPDSTDLAEVVRAGSRERGVAVLLERCIVAERAGEPLALTSLSQRELGAATERLSCIDPGAEIAIEIACVQCGVTHSVLFDVASFLWAEIGVEAQRLLREVDVLARRYGWDEARILAMSPQRRRAYLALGLE